MSTNRPFPAVCAYGSCHLGHFEVWISEVRTNLSWRPIVQSQTSDVPLALQAGGCPGIVSAVLPKGNKKILFRYLFTIFGSILAKFGVATMKSAASVASLEGFGSRDQVGC